MVVLKAIYHYVFPIVFLIGLMYLMWLVANIKEGFCTGKDDPRCASQLETVR